ncbi:hypothetical protein PIB30_075803 [Stylosanthes scabra]|uniref:Uncharacterized protein n=1 Tax=Stylosanthes scabra TaxID=79078 RepID=A0ABU6VQC2_9FABA|nr:hypothetical protein [Stylosanthes scabra]
MKLSSLSPNPSQLKPIAVVPFVAAGRRLAAPEEPHHPVVLSWCWVTMEKPPFWLEKEDVAVAATTLLFSPSRSPSSARHPLPPSAATSAAVCSHLCCLHPSPNLETLDCKGLHHLTSLRNLSIKYCHNLENITEEHMLASIEYIVHIEMSLQWSLHCSLEKFEFLHLS